MTRMGDITDTAERAETNSQLKSIKYALWLILIAVVALGLDILNTLVNGNSFFMGG